MRQERYGWVLERVSTVENQTLEYVAGCDLPLDAVVQLYDAVGWSAYTKEPDNLAAALGLARVISDARVSDFAGMSKAFLSESLIRFNPGWCVASFNHGDDEVCLRPRRTCFQGQRTTHDFREFSRGILPRDLGTLQTIFTEGDLRPSQGRVQIDGFSRYRA